jgi:hypothetical protein
MLRLLTTLVVFFVLWEQCLHSPKSPGFCRFAPRRGNGYSVFVGVVHRVANPVHTKKDDVLSSFVLVYLFEGLSRFDGLEQEAIVECGPRATTRQESDAE